MSDLTEDERTAGHHLASGRCISCKHWTHLGNQKFWNDWANCARIPDAETPGHGDAAGEAYVDGQGMYNGALITHSQFGCVLYERKVQS